MSQAEKNVEFGYLLNGRKGNQDGCVLNPAEIGIVGRGKNGGLTITFPGGRSVEVSDENELEIFDSEIQQ